MVANVFGDDNRPGFNSTTTKQLLSGPSSPSRGEGRVPFALDREAREAAIVRAGAFEGFASWSRVWSLSLDTDQTVALYSTYSNITGRHDRSAVLAELRRIAAQEFGGQVVRNMITSRCVAKRRT